MQVSYTYSHSLDDASSFEGAGFGGERGYNQYDTTLNYGNSDFDARHRLVIAPIYAIPFSSSGGALALRNLLLSGWEVSGVVTFATGHPFDISYQGGESYALYCSAPAAIHRSSPALPTLIKTSIPVRRLPIRSQPSFQSPVTPASCSLSIPLKSASTLPDIELGYFYYTCPDVQNQVAPLKRFNPHSLTNTVKGQLFDGSVVDPTDPTTSGNSFAEENYLTPGVFGNISRNKYFGPGIDSTNVQLSKNIRFGSDSSRFIQLRIESYNVFNHTNFNNPNGNTDNGPATAGVITSAAAGRQFQLSGKIYF